jgi:hypothetical protein
MVYDHLLTLPRERRLVWRAPAGAAKYAFLLTRYLVPAGMLATVYEKSGFIGTALSDAACRRLDTLMFVLATASVALANVMVLIRVIALWEHRAAVARALTVAFLASYGTVFGLLVVTITRVIRACAALSLHTCTHAPPAAGIQYNALAGMCVATTTSGALLGVWAAAMVFEAAVLAAIVWNAVDRPRTADQRLAHVLRRDGIIYFACVAARARACVCAR